MRHVKTKHRAVAGTMTWQARRRKNQMTTNTLEMEINEAVNGANGTNGVATIDEAIDEIAAEAT